MEYRGCHLPVGGVANLGEMREDVLEQKQLIQIALSLIIDLFERLY